MKLQLKNIIPVFKNVRARNIIFVTGFILLFGFLYGLAHVMSEKGQVANSVELKASPTINSVPGGVDHSPPMDYQRLQIQQNLQQAALAEKTGASSIPSLIDSNSFNLDQKGMLDINNMPCSRSSCPETPRLPLQPSLLRPGTLIYDTEGKVVAHLDSEGTAHDSQNKIVGQIAPDGLVRSLNDNTVIGISAVPALADSVRDLAGNLLGTVGKGGTVRSIKGNSIGFVDPDGIVRDSKKAILGKVMPLKRKGSLVASDKEGHFLGIVRPDGEIKDIHGKTIAKVDAQGVVRNREGENIGRIEFQESPKDFIPGSPAYDDQGRFIGTLGQDRRIRDDDENVIGTIDKSGFVHNTKGEVIAKLGSTAPGTPIYNKQGQLVGTVGREGLVRGLQGKVLGYLDKEGIVRDRQGHVLGSTQPPKSANLLDTPATVSLANSESPNPQNSELQAVLDRQAQQISDQKAQQLQEQMQASMSTQATQLFTAWSSPNQQYVGGVSGPEIAQFGNRNTLLSTSGLAEKPAIKAGTILYATLYTAINSDEPGPVVADIFDGNGRFSKARLIGSLSNQGKKVLVSFTTLNLPNLSQSIPVNAIAIDENTARTALSSDTNSHYWLRYGTLFASAFLQGYGQSFLNVGSPYAGSIIINPSDKYPKPDLNPKERLFVGLGQVGLKYSSVLSNVFNTPPTVRVYSGTAIGILFLSDLVLPPVK